MTGTDDAWRALEEFNGFIRFADAKAVAALTASGLLAGWVLAGFPPRHLLGAQAGPALLAGGSLGALAVATLYALQAIRPRTHVDDRGSLIHFADAARSYQLSPDRFMASCASLFAVDAELMDEICRQLGVNATVAAVKFRYVDHAFAGFAIGLGLAVAAALARLL